MLLVFLFAGLSFFFAKIAYANEGVIEITSETDDVYRCWASSVRMRNQEYRIPFTCRNLIYPANDSVFNYIMWATPQDGGNTIKLGAVGLGRGVFSTKKPFTNIFITTESNKDVKTPQGQVVMRGTVESIEPFFQEGPTATPTPIPEGEEVGEEVGEGEEEQPQELTTREKFLLALRRAGIAALIALVALVGLIFVVTRSRG